MERDRAMSDINKLHESLVASLREIEIYPEDPKFPGMTIKIAPRNCGPIATMMIERMRAAGVLLEMPSAHDIALAISQGEGLYPQASYQDLGEFVVRCLEWKRTNLTEPLPQRPRPSTASRPPEA
jgi:hypothetical protein